MSPLRLRPLILVLFIALNATAIAWYLVALRKGASPIRVHAESGKARKALSVTDLGLPEFSLTDRFGKTVTRADFEGRPWILDFIYTDCPAQCPMMMTKMSALQKTLPDGAGFATITVNPEKDSPAVLSTYAQRFDADATRWRFLTGPKKEIENILASLGAMPTGRQAPSVASADAHSIRFYLIDEKGRVVGLYDTSDEDSLKNLSQDVRQLIEEGSA